MLDEEVRHFAAMAAKAAVLNFPTTFNFYETESKAGFDHLLRAADQLLKFDLFSPDTFDFWVSYGYWARMWCDLPKMNEAIENARKTLVRSDGNPTHHSVAIAKLTGDYYLATEQLDDAETAYRFVLDGKSKGLAKDSFRVLGQLAIVYFKTGRLQEAETLISPIMDQVKYLDPEDKIAALPGYSILVGVMTGSGRFSEAETLAQEYVVAAKEVLGEDSLEHATSLRQLAEIKLQTDQLVEAERLLIESIRIGRNSVGDNHPRLAEGLQVLADTYRALGKYANAESALEESVSIIRNAYGEKHTQYGLALFNFSNLYKATGDFGKALPLIKESISVFQDCAGHKGNLGIAKCSLASILAAMGSLDEAEHFFKQSIDDTCDALGPLHVNGCRARMNLAKLYVSQRKIPESIEQLEFLFENKVFPEESTDYAGSLYYLGWAKYLLGEKQVGSELCCESLRKLQRNLGEHHPVYLNLYEGYRNLTR